MGRAQKSDIRGASVAAQPVGVVVMELQPTTLGTSSTVRALVRTLTLVSLPHKKRFTGAEISAHSLRRVGLFEALSRFLDFTEALGLHPFEFLRHGRLDHGNEIGTRQCGRK